jgi:hypothetical protein
MKVPLALTLVAVLGSAAHADELTRVDSRRWPTGTLAFERADSMRACRAEVERQGEAASVCAKGARYWINNGVRVRVTATSGDAATVTILEGPHAGQRAVVGSDELGSGAPREREQATPSGPESDKEAAARAAAEASAREARIKAAGAARARCLHNCLGVPYGPAGLPACEDACRDAYQRAVGSSR